MTRSIHKLEWAHQLDGWPDSIPRSRPRGAKALGTRYEKSVARELPGCLRGVWWAYRDYHGPGLCQTDILLRGRVWAAILECKLTWTAEGMDQLKRLYLPVVERALNQRVIGIQICKNLIPDYVGTVYDDLEAAIAAAKEKQLVTIHWRGFGQLTGDNKWPTPTQKDQLPRRTESPIT